MANDVTLDLGTHTISSHLDKTLVLAVTASMSLSLPEEYPGVQTAAELRERVRAGSLWISRAGSCSFELSVELDDLLGDGLREHLEHAVIRAFETSPAWKALGLDLRREYNRFHDLPSPNTPYPYSIQHAQQNCGLVSPDHVPHAYFSTLFCRLSFGTDEDDVKTEADASPRRERIVTLKLSSRKLRRFAKRKRPERQDTMARVDRTRRVAPKTSPRDLHRVTMDGPGAKEERLESLTHMAMNLLLGLRKKYPGVRVQGRAKSPTLLEIAPAVWNARYFQDVVSRARLAPVISSALRNLVSTESPSLRQKLRAQGLDTTEELHRHILVLVLKSTRAPKIDPRALRTSVPSQNMDGMDTDRNDEQVGLEARPARETDERSLRAGVGDSATLQDDGSSCEIDSDYRWHTDQHDFASSSSQPPSFRFRPGVVGQPDTDVRFDEEQLHDTGPCAVADDTRAMQQKYRPLSSNMDENLRGFYPETTETSRHDDENYLDEDYLEAEKELAKILASGLEPPLSEDDYDDEFYLETEQQLAELLSRRHRADPKFQRFAGDDLMDMDVDAADPVDPDVREMVLEACEDDAEGHGCGGLDDGILDAIHHELHAQYVNAGPFSHLWPCR